MTAALTTQAPSATGRSAPRQLRWLLRLHRPALIACVALTVLLGAALLWLAGPVTDSAAAALKEFSACDYTPPCSYDRGAVDLHTNLYTYTTFAVLIVPFLFAAWAGGSLIGREMESGTAHFAWTQGVSPARWLVSRLAFPAALTITVTGLTGWLHRRAWAAGKHLQTSKPWDDALTFYANGTFPVALALTGLAVGVLAGLVLRRALTALATAVATIGVLWAAVHTALPSLWPSVTRVTSLEKGLEGEGIWISEGILTADGERLSSPCYSSGLPSCRAAMEDMGAVKNFRVYHPESHYWPLQLVASGILLVIAVLVTVAAFQLLRRRTGRTKV